MNYLEAAKFIGTKKQTFDMALECGADRFLNNVREVWQL